MAVLSDQECVKQNAVEIIDRQIERESASQDGSYKACIWGLHCLRTLVENYEVYDCTAEQFAQDLIKLMRKLQREHDSEFIDEYNSAKAAIGSAINSFEYSIQTNKK